MCTNEILNVGFGEADLIVDDVQGEDAKGIKSRLIPSPSILEVGTASNLNVGGNLDWCLSREEEAPLGKPRTWDCVDQACGSLLELPGSRGGPLARK